MQPGTLCVLPHRCLHHALVDSSKALAPPRSISHSHPPHTHYTWSAAWVSPSTCRMLTERMLELYSTFGIHASKVYTYPEGLSSEGNRTGMASVLTPSHRGASPPSWFFSQDTGASVAMPPVDLAPCKSFSLAQTQARLPPPPSLLAFCHWRSFGC